MTGLGGNVGELVFLRMGSAGAQVHRAVTRGPRPCLLGVGSGPVSWEQVDPSSPYQLRGWQATCPGTQGRPGDPRQMTGRGLCPGTSPPPHTSPRAIVSCRLCRLPTIIPPPGTESLRSQCLVVPVPAHLPSGLGWAGDVVMGRSRLWVSTHTCPPWQPRSPLGPHGAHDRRGQPRVRLKDWLGACGWQ